MISEQDGQIIVEELRDMGEAENRVEVLALVSGVGSEPWIVVKLKEDGLFYSEDRTEWSANEFDGFIPMPQYKPKKIEPFHQKDVPGKLREISSFEEAGELGRSAAESTIKLMQT